MRLILCLLVFAAFAASCSSAADGSAGDQPTADSEPATATTEDGTQAAGSPAKGPGGYGFDRSDPEAGIANIMAAFATDEDTATCIYEAWGDVANVAPAELTPELMTFEICGTSIFQLMTGDGRFTGADG